jgi:hypothetical protein
VSIMGAEEEGEGEEGYEGQAWEGNGGKFQGLGGGTEHLEESLPGLGGKAQRPSTAKRPRPTAAAGGGGKGGKAAAAPVLGQLATGRCVFMCVFMWCVLMCIYVGFAFCVCLCLQMCACACLWIRE